MNQLIDLREAERNAAGPKAGALGHLLRAGFPVPPGFVLPASADPDLARIGVELNRLVREFGTPHVAVRSSATGEDLGGASAAGQFETVLGACGAESVLAAVHTVRASLGSERAEAYRGVGADPGTMTVLVQSLVPAYVSGVMFTGAAIRVEATWGLGESVVGGRVTPDNWVVSGGTVTARRLGDKDLWSDITRDGVATLGVSPGDRKRLCLTDPEVIQLAELGAAVQALLGGPQDIEWAIDAEGRAWILQARPVTAVVPDAPVDSDADPEPDSDASEALVGLAASSGQASGPVRVVRGLDDFPRIRPGDVLVCPTTDPAWTPLFRIAAAVVTERGGLLCHAAIVAREFGIPAVLAVADATTTLAEGTLVEVDGDIGTIRVIDRSPDDARQRP